MQAMDEEDTPSSSEQQTELLLSRVVHVLDPTNFWIQIGTNELFERFAQLEDQLQEFCDEAGSLCRDDGGQMEDKSFVVVRSKLHSAWRRAQIARQNLDKRTVDVLHMDYGTTEIVSLDQICAAVPAFFFAVDHQAWMCSLAGIRPIAKTWTSRGIKYFQNLTKDVLLQACVVLDQATFSNLQIALYTNEGPDGHSLAHLMLEEEMGMPCDIEKVPEYARDVVQVFPQMYDYQEQYGDIYNEGEADGGYEEFLDTNYESSPASQQSKDYHKMSFDQSQSNNLGTHAKTQAPPNHSLTVKHQPFPQDDDTQPDQEEMREPESPGEAIPGFNLNSIFKTKMASADLITQKKEDARKKAVTTAMAKDMELMRKDMEEAVSETEVTEWGASDYDIGKQTLDTKPDVCYQKVAEIREAIGDTSWNPSKTEGHGPHKPVLQEIRAAATADVEPSPGPVAENKQIIRNQDYGNKSEVGVTKGGSPTPGERLESSLSKQLSKIVDEGDLDDPGSLCHQFNKVVQSGGLKEPWGLAVVIEVLLETAITLSSPQQVILLNVLDTYVDSPNFDIRLQTVLRQLENRFVRPAFGKAKSYCKEFGQVLGQLNIMSRLWNRNAADVVQDFVMHQLEKWAIFNRYGYQMGVQTEKTHSVYMECLEGLWDIAADTITDMDPSRFVKVQEWLQDKVLAQSHPREIRESTLKLLLKLGPVKMFNADQIKAPTLSVETQTEVSSFENTDPESSAFLHPEDSSLFSHFDTEIEDVSPSAVDIKHSAESSPIHQSSALSRPAPIAPFTQSHHPSHPSHNACDIPSKGKDDLTPALSQLGTWAHTVNVAKKRSPKSDCRDVKELSGLRALALQTLNGEKYVFSGRFMQDLPPRFKKHLGTQEEQELKQENLGNDSHFYRKGKVEGPSQGLDYQTPKEMRESVKTKDLTERTGSTPTSDSNKTERSSSSDEGKSYYSKLGLGDFPSVKDILNSSMEHTDTGSETGSDWDTPKPRSVTPVDWWKATGQAKGKQDHQDRKQSSMNRNTPSPRTVTKKGLNPHAQEWSPRKRGQNTRSLSRSPAPLTESSSSGDNSSFARGQSPNSSFARGQSPNSSFARRQSPNSSFARGQSPSLKQSSPHGNISAADPHSIRSIVTDIFGDGDGKYKTKSQNSQSLEIEKFVLGDNTTDTDGANTSYNVSEITSKVDEGRTVVSDVSIPESCSKDATILPEYANKHYNDDEFDDDYDDDDDGFIVSGFDDQSFNSENCRQEASCVDTGSTEHYVKENKDVGIKWEDMDFSKPMDATPAKPRTPRYNWVPGQRKCTLCGDSDHTVYSCKNRKSVIF